MKNQPMESSRKEGGLKRQSGAATVEFAFVFPVLLLLIYGMVAYAYLFVIQQSLVFAAQEAAEAAVKVDPTTGTDAQRENYARVTATQVLSWLPADQRSRVLGDENGSAVGVSHCDEGSPQCPADSDGVIVQLTFNLQSPQAMFPSVSIMGLVSFPPMPATLVARAVARV